MVGQGLVEVVSQVPADAKAVGHNGHKLPLASQSFKEEDKLEFEEDHRLDARAAGGSVALLDQTPHERKIENPFQATIGVVFRDEFFEGETGQWGEAANLGAHHSGASPLVAGAREAHASNAWVSTPAHTSTQRVFFNTLLPAKRPRQ